MQLSVPELPSQIGGTDVRYKVREESGKWEYAILVDGTVMHMNDPSTGRHGWSQVDPTAWINGRMRKVIEVHPQEGCTRCWCGSKYWDGDICHSCGTKYTEA